MIHGNLDTISDLNYFGLGGHFQAAFRYLHDLRKSRAHVCGKTSILGDKVWVNGISKNGCPKAGEMEFEYHKRYADVHWCMTGEETIAWSPNADGMTPSGAFETSKDCGMLRGAVSNVVHLKGDCFVILFPGEPHAPLIGEGLITKVCVKVEMDAQ
ncbi:YhcH/YjgK/YiaL family protein [Geminisphaera colitermitum]|uniref:YhcH/YjgK/YiaL family protein n=1 Tax=Geminisphaera colitermitum TaxID=1148786 RepID=UPI000158D16D|nr:YhcH/YjgK/YiaL family protein [Geminisphaera colitermitum]